MILWPPTALSDTPMADGYAAAPHSAVGVSVAILASVLAVALVAFVILVPLGPWRSFSAFGPSSDETPAATSAIDLEPPVDGGRDIIVAGDGSGHFRTISDAVAAAVDGDRIEVMPGTYHDSVTITTDISIHGVGARDEVIVQPSDDEPDGDQPVARNYPFSDELVPGWTFVMYLQDSQTHVSNLTIRGAAVGTAVVIDGGAPSLENVVIDPEGEQRNHTGTDLHEGLAFAAGTTATVSGSTITAFVGVGEASTPTLTDNVIDGACIVVSGVGSDPTIRANHVQGSQCPHMSVWVLDGASPIIDANAIVSDQQTDGIRVSGPGFNPTISGNTVTGGEYGIWVGDEADATIRRNHVTVAGTGIEIAGSDVVLDTNDVRSNGIGIVLDKGAVPIFEGNTVCENDINLAIRGGAAASVAGNDICEDAGGGDVARVEP